MAIWMGETGGIRLERLAGWILSTQRSARQMLISAAADFRLIG